jgi:hypothetical protein
MNGVLVANQIKGADFFVAFQGPPGAFDDDSASVVTAHDIQRYSHR